MKKIFLTTLLLFIVLMSACNSNNESQQTKSHSVAVSMYPLEFLISKIANEHVDVDTVIPPGTDPHVYEPSSKKMIELSSNDAFFYIGAQLEAFGETLANAVAEQGLSVYQLADHEELFETNNDSHPNNTHEHDEESHGHQHDYNPHFWLDPVRMSHAAEIIASDLTEIYPEFEESFRQNLSALQTELAQLDQEYATLTIHDYTLFVTHEAFDYWTERYGVEQLSVRGVSSSQEPSQKELKQIFDEVNHLDIDHIILETISQDRLAKTIAEEMDLRILKIHTLESLTERDIQQNKDYFDLMRENLNVIKETKK